MVRLASHWLSQNRKRKKKKIINRSNASCIAATHLRSPKPSSRRCYSLFGSGAELQNQVTAERVKAGCHTRFVGFTPLIFNSRRYAVTKAASQIRFDVFAVTI
ncbi:hypothetical protein D8B26_003256 [Coccidioides posadasii str. Silveira]|uniref:uncharacterized protein n=1 Tax=Coccidioides posadasii (strain RMSCC 757 / Silveira) TaxID=443226 RepID=UPI001BEEFCE7|nr:hypothetical protein D8B26_003256 [Coccidioides posadasii str. Silveira]